jgi:hypothetical protein
VDMPELELVAPAELTTPFCTREPHAGPGKLNSPNTHQKNRKHAETALPPPTNLHQSETCAFVRTCRRQGRYEDTHRPHAGPRQDLTAGPRSGVNSSPGPRPVRPRQPSVRLRAASGAPPAGGGCTTAATSFRRASTPPITPSTDLCKATWLPASCHIRSSSDDCFDPTETTAPSKVASFESVERAKAWV